MKEKLKTGPILGQHVSYDMKIRPKPGPRGVNKLHPVGSGLKCRVLIQDYNKCTV